MLKRFWSIFFARNKEYFRDRAAFGWNFLFPFLIIAGFAVMFQRGGHMQYKCGVIPLENPKAVREPLPSSIKDTGLLKVVELGTRDAGFEKLRHHRLDLVLEYSSGQIRYWISDSSPKGAIAEGLLLRSLYAPDCISDQAVRKTVGGSQLDYIDWLFPGIIAMNMMFSGLYGVGYVIVRYRKSGVLKRLKVTPLTAFEYLAAQVVSRLFLLLFSNTVLYAGCALLFNFHCRGSYLDLILLFSLGSISIISLGLVVAARGSSEEFANGVLNMISWPMMFLSQVWFSLEGAPGWVHVFARFFPLIHITEGMRRIMNEGATLGELSSQIMALSAMTLVFMLIGSALFKWTKD
ncbi:ABC transporter permease [Desulfococcaceae bacterium HSG8]|nr:ABC transporter permease [Desulfococcaceae bacterium HSG8]